MNQWLTLSLLEETPLPAGWSPKVTLNMAHAISLHERAVSPTNDTRMTIIGFFSANKEGETYYHVTESVDYILSRLDARQPVRS